MSSTVALRCLSSNRSSMALLAVSLAALSAVAPESALAQSTRPRAAQSPAPRPASQPAGPLIGVVSLGSQKVTFYNRHGVVAQSPISSGRKGFETPEGVFSILERKEEHFSNLYDDASMPFMQRITWSGVAMHAGNLPGYAASHGCIRLPYSFAERLFGLTKLNTRIVVTQRDVVPQPIAHPVLFQPRLASEPPVAAAPSAAPPATPRPAPAFKSEGGAETPMMLGVRPARPETPEATSPTPAPQREVTTVLEAARVQQAAATQKAAEANKIADAAKLVVKTRLVEAQKAERASKAQTALLKRAEGKVVAAERATTRARSEEAAEKAKEAHTRALEELEAVKKLTDDLKTAALERSTEVRSATDAAKAADAARNAAQAEARIAARMLDPISVFVSRKAGRLYVRQGRNPVFDVAFTIKDPQRPIGTHVFTAMEDAGPNQVRWNIVTVEGGQADTPPPQSRKRGETSPRPAPIDVSGSVLTRLEFPQDLLDRITPYVQLGSSLVVSDHAPSIETGRNTDFVVQTRGEERAREFIANYVAEQKAAEQQKKGYR